MRRGIKKLRFVVTAGPTREHLDPVRFLSNPSTGRMGFAVARAAARCGCDVTLVAGPVSLKTPKGVRRVDVTDAREMLRETKRALASAGKDAFLVATAAVADWRPAVRASRKLRKGEMSGTLRLVRNPDVLASVRCAHKIGFAAETDDVLAEAARKCREKGLEMIVANDVTERGCGFGTATNRVTFLAKDGSVTRLPLMSKLAVAGRIVRFCESLAREESAGSRA